LGICFRPVGEDPFGEEVRAFGRADMRLVDGRRAGKRGDEALSLPT
jgi:hypothetical protein